MAEASLSGGSEEESFVKEKERANGPRNESCPRHKIETPLQLTHARLLIPESTPLTLNQASLAGVKRVKMHAPGLP